MSNIDPNIFEKKLAKMDKRITTIYNRFYARHVRREKIEKRMLERFKRWSVNADKIPDMKRIAQIITKEANGKIIPFLDEREYRQLKEVLRRKIIFKSRKSQEPK